MAGSKPCVKLIKMGTVDFEEDIFISKPLSLHNFYGKISQRASQVKTFRENRYNEKSPLSDAERYKQHTQKIKPSVILGNSNTRHNVKRIRSTKKFGSMTEKRNRGAAIALSSPLEETDGSEESDEETSGKIENENPNSIHRRSTLNASKKPSKLITKMQNKEYLVNGKVFKKSAMKQARRPLRSQRKAAHEVADKIENGNKMFKSVDDVVKMRYIRSESDWDSSNSDSVNLSESNELTPEAFPKARKNTKKPETVPVQPKFSEYERAAQEKIAKRMAFLKSLNITPLKSELFGQTD